MLAVARVGGRATNGTPAAVPVIMVVVILNTVQLAGMENTRTPGQRAGLSRPAVLAAAQGLVGEHGVGGLTMRALADRLDVRPNALYSHVANKDALLGELLEETLARVEAPPANVADPIGGLRTLLTTIYRALAEQPGLAPFWPAGQGPGGPHGRRLGTLVERLLARAGTPDGQAATARRVLLVYTIGFATQAPPREPVGFAVPDATPPRPAADFATGLDWLLTGIGEPPAVPD